MLLLPLKKVGCVVVVFDESETPADGFFAVEDLAVGDCVSFTFGCLHRVDRIEKHGDGIVLLWVDSCPTPSVFLADSVVLERFRKGDGSTRVGVHKI